MSKDKKLPDVPPLVGEVLREIGLEPQTAGWWCHKTYVLLHKALEKVAAQRGVVFDPPEILYADVSQKEAVVMCVGKMGDKSEWSIGEAAPYNNKNDYPFAMAEKRAKDRVILKLVGLHGDAYSEAEADEFLQSRPDEAGTIEIDEAALDLEPATEEAAPPTEALQLFNQAITHSPTIVGVISMWQTNLEDGLGLESMKESQPDDYKSAKEHRDTALIHALGEIKDVATLQNLLTQESKKPLNHIRKINEKDFKSLMKLATARKQELSIQGD